MRRPLLTTSITLAAFVSHDAGAGAWLAPHKKHELFVTVRGHHSDRYYDETYSERDACPMYRHDIEGYWEYGLRPHFTVGTKQIIQHASKNRTLKNQGGPCDARNSAADKNSGVVWKEQRYFARFPVYQGRGNRVISLQPEIFFPGIFPDNPELFGDEAYGVALRLSYGRAMRTRIIRKPFDWLPAFKWIPEVTWERFFNRELMLEQDFGAGTLRGGIEDTHGFSRRNWFFWTKLRASFVVARKGSPPNYNVRYRSVSGDYDYAGYTFTAGYEFKNDYALMGTFIDDLWGRNYRTGQGFELSVRRRF